MTQTMNYMKKNNRKGFTLIELIVVIAILAILAAILIPSMLGYISDSNDSVAEANARSVYSAACSVYTSQMSKGTTPAVADVAPDDFETEVIAALGSGFKAADFEIAIGANGITSVTYTRDGTDYIYTAESGTAAPSVTAA